VKRILLVAVLTACGTPPSANEPHSHSPEASEGAELYARYCALCHGADGQGYAADNATRLNGDGFLRTASDEFLFTAIARGRLDTAMGPYSREHGGPLADAQIDAIVALLRSWQRGPAIEVDQLEISGDPERGAQIYTERCASCHGTLAEGATAQSLSASSFSSTASDGFLRYAIVNGREGTPMPAFGDVLQAQAIDDLVAFLRRFEENPGAIPAHLAPPSLAAVPLMRHPDGPRPQFTLREGRFVSAAQVRDAVDRGARIILLDARPTSDWLRRRLPGALPVPYYDAEPIVDRLPRDGTWMVAYCGCPHAASGAVVDTLRAAGFENTAVLDEGVYHWIDQGYPTETGPIEQ
jgi:mono/diheme cytochrome c family protein/rhodanese-related sulfurtransferase